MAHALGRLAAAAAGHWKRSLALVAVVLVVIGGAATRRRRLVRRLLQHARDGVPAGRRPAHPAVPGAVRRHRDARLRRGERSLQGNAAIAETRGAVERQPHVTGVSEVQLSARRADRLPHRPVRQARAGPPASARASASETVASIGERGRPRGLAPRPDRRPGGADERPRRRADRARGRDPRPHARLPQRRRDAADADRQPDRAGRRHPAAAASAPPSPTSRASPRRSA